MQANDSTDPKRPDGQSTGPKRAIPHINIEDQNMILGGPIQTGSTEWLKGTGEMSDVVMSSRARAARNLAGFPFPPRCFIRGSLPDHGNLQAMYRIARTPKGHHRPMV